MESSKEKVARGGQDQKNRKLLEKGLRSRGRHCASANGLGILMDERRKGTSPVVFHFQILARVLPLSSTSRLRISRSGRQVPTFRFSIRRMRVASLGPSFVPRPDVRRGIAGIP